MKNGLLLLLVLFAQIAYGQNIVETRIATLTDGDYSLEGTVYLELYDDGALDLRFDSSYLTQSNVYDVHVFLTNDNNYANPIDTAGLLLVENIGTIDGLDYSSGPITFNLPAEVGIDDYQHIVFICVKFGQLHWGDGSFGESVLTSTTKIEEAEKIKLNVFPNPSEKGRVEIQFQDLRQEVLLEVLNLNGQLVFSEQIIGKSSHFIELKEAGTYFLRFTADGSSTVRKLIRL